MPQRRLRIILIAVLALIVLVAGIAVVRAASGSPAPARSHAAGPAATSSPSAPAPRMDDVLRLPETDDAVRYARAVAVALYRWSTVDTNPDRVMRLLLDDADPSGRELNGLAADLRRHLPTTDQWRLLRDYSTRQDLRIESAEVPEGWSAIQREGRDRLVPGTVAVTIVGVRLREGEWNGDRTSAAHPVTFTVFVGCSPGFDRCHLLRLSVLGEALE
jgi:hypothetical protein